MSRKRPSMNELADGLLTWTRTGQECWVATGICSYKLWVEARQPGVKWYAATVEVTGLPPMQLLPKTAKPGLRLGVRVGTLEEAVRACAQHERTVESHVMMKGVTG